MNSLESVIPVTEPPPLPARPGIWSGLGTVALYFVFQALAAFVLMFFGALVWAAVEGAKGHKPSVDQIMQLASTPWFLTVLAVGSVIVSAGLIMWLVHRFWPALWRLADPPGFGLVMPASRWWFALAVAVGVAVVFLGGWLTQWLAQGQEFQQDVSTMGMGVGVGMRLLLGALVVIVAPLVEELLFRGVLLSGLMRRMHVVWAVLFSALLFGCVHLPDFKFAWYPVPALALFGAVLAILRLKSRSLWIPVTAHATNNLIGVIAWFVVAAAQP